jgi:hypothetical protein
LDGVAVGRGGLGGSVRDVGELDGFWEAICCLISSSATMRPSSMFTRNMRPGWRRPLEATLAGSTGRTPASEPMMT